jgi:hypothetical protein
MVIKSRRMKGAGHGSVDKCIQTWEENLKERDHLKDLGVDERIFVKYILQK